MRHCIARGVLLSCLLGLTACGDGFTFFFISNPGVFDDVQEKGGVIIAIDSRDDDEEDPLTVTVLDGEIPPGMMLHVEGTLEGNPEESGVFEFSAEWEYADGTSRLESYTVEVE